MITDHIQLDRVSSYESVYARYYINASTMQYGYLNMILLFITVIVTPVICSLADRRRAHRTYFVVSLITTAVAVSFYTFLPLILDSPRWNKHLVKTPRPLEIGPWIYFCFIALMCDLSMGINTCLCDSFAVYQAEVNSSSFGRIIVWGTFGWAGSAVVLMFINQCNFLPRLMPGLIFGSLLLTLDILLVIFWPKQDDFKLDYIPVDAAQTFTASTYSVHRDPSDYLPGKGVQINLGQQVDSNDGQLRRRTLSPLDVVGFKNKAEEGGKSDPILINREEKTVVGAKNASGVNQEHHEKGLGAPVSSVMTIHSELEGQTKFKQVDDTQKTPTLVKEKVEILDDQTKSSKIVDDPAKRVSSSSAASSNVQGSRRTSFRLQLVILRLILKRRRQLIRYLVLFVLAGFFMSVHWNYFFLYLEEIYSTEFEFISAVSMVSQSMLGELPFFILSRKVIGLLGRSHTLSLSILSIGVRYILYLCLLPNHNMYYIIVADCFQGPNYGLFYVAMTEISLEYSYCDDDTVSKLAAMGEIDASNQTQVDSLRLSLRSTVQSVAFACYEGIGVGLGSVAGGYVVATYGFSTLWLYMAIGAIVVGSANLLIEFSCRESDPEDNQSERKEYMESRRRRFLRKSNSPDPGTLAGQPGRPTPPIAAPLVGQVGPQVAPQR